jgi:hypothetical protein
MLEEARGAPVESGQMCAMSADVGKPVGVV